MRTKIYKEYKDIKDTDKLLKQQVFLSTYIDKEYDNIDRMLLFHGIGSGKTCSSITIAETIMKKQPQMEVLVILPARLKTNFIDELISETCGFNKYISVNEYAKYIDDKTTKKEKEQIRKVFLKRIELKYNIISYESLRNQLLKTTNLDETIKKITNNKIIIIDEVHNLISSGIDKAKFLEIITNNKIKLKTKTINSIILRLLTYYTKDQKFTKMFFLTATPVFDNYGQFIELMLNLRPDLLNENIHKSATDIKKYINYLKGKISFFKIKDKSAYPKVITNNVHITMSDTQRELIEDIKYKNSKDSLSDNDDEKGNMFCVGERQLAISTYDISKAKKIYENLNEYAPKLKAIIEFINQNQGKHLVYSNFIKYCLELIVYILEKEGWSNYTKNGINPYKTFVLWDSSLNDESKQNVKSILNSPDNIDGKNIRVILGSPSIKEGVSFKHVQFLHQVDPVWNTSAKDQIEGRCIRYKSHEDIPLDHPFLRRIVTIYNYILTSQDDDIDENGEIKDTCEYKIYYKIMPKKEAIINILNKLLSKVSLDYYLWTATDESPKTHSNSSVISVSEEQMELLNLLKKKKNYIDGKCPPGKILNPSTGKCVKIDGVIGKRILKGNIYTKEICLEWKKNKLINPITKRKIEANKGVYNNLKTNCIDVLTPEIESTKKPSPTKPSSTKKSSSGKSESSLKTYKIINSSELENLSKYDVIIDPAGLDYMKTSIKGAGKLSGEIYDIYIKDKVTKNVSNFFNQFPSEKELYQKYLNNYPSNKHQLVVYDTYHKLKEDDNYPDNITIIHVVGPDFRIKGPGYDTYYIIKNTKIDEINILSPLYKLFYSIYDNIFKTFLEIYKKNNNYKLRLIPISSGMFSGSTLSKEKILKCLKIILNDLSKKYKSVNFSLFIYIKEDYDIYNSF